MVALNVLEQGIDVGKLEIVGVEFNEQVFAWVNDALKETFPPVEGKLFDVALKF